MYCDNPLDKDSILEIKPYKAFKDFNIVLINLTVLTDENGFWNYKKHQ